MRPFKTAKEVVCYGFSINGLIFNGSLVKILDLLSKNHLSVEGLCDSQPSTVNFNYQQESCVLLKSFTFNNGKYSIK